MAKDLPEFTPAKSFDGARDGSVRGACAWLRTGNLEGRVDAKLHCKPGTLDQKAVIAKRSYTVRRYRISGCAETVWNGIGKLGAAVRYARYRNPANVGPVWNGIGI